MSQYGYNQSNTTVTTAALSLIDPETFDDIFITAGWINLAIRILGLITNPLIIVVLSRHRVGSK